MWSLSSLRKLKSSSSISINGGLKSISHVQSRFSSGSSYGGDNEMERNSMPQDNMENMNSQDNLSGPTLNTRTRNYLHGEIDSLGLAGGFNEMGSNPNLQNNFRGQRDNYGSQYNYRGPRDNHGSQYNYGGPRGNMRSQNSFRKPMMGAGSVDVLRETMNAVSASGNPDMRRNRPMDFVRGTLEQDHFAPQYSLKNNAHFVLIQLGRNNTHINVTDAKGDTKFWAASGNKNVGGGKVARYAAEATSEFVGRRVKEMGVKAVVIRVKGFTYFKKKRLAVMGFKEGFSSSRSAQNPIKYIEDVTRKPHNGCRLPKKRRI
ncbi:30S ribosomal protein S11 [Euphorbia peplus]|nr:30S ribosomal protein S11 [Euphorbia peplus]